jgi:hypothetical protein
LQKTAHENVCGFSIGIEKEEEEEEDRESDESVGSQEGIEIFETVTIVK